MNNIKQCLACRYCRMHTVLRVTLVFFALGFSMVATGVLHLPV